MLPERRDQPTCAASPRLTGNTGWPMRDWRADWVGIAINGLHFSPPLAFELGQSLISHADIAEVVPAHTFSAGSPNRVPVQKIVRSQPLILPSPSGKDMGNRLPPLQKKETRDQPALPCLDILSQEQSE